MLDAFLFEILDESFYQSYRQTSSVVLWVDRPLEISEKDGGMRP